MGRTYPLNLTLQGLKKALSQEFSRQRITVSKIRLRAFLASASITYNIHYIRNIRTREENVASGAYNIKAPTILYIAKVILQKGLYYDLRNMFNMNVGAQFVKILQIL